MKTITKNIQSNTIVNKSSIFDKLLICEKNLFIIKENLSIINKEKNDKLLLDAKNLFYDNKLSIMEFGKLKNAYERYFFDLQSFCKFNKNIVSKYLKEQKTDEMQTIINNIELISDLYCPLRFLDINKKKTHSIIMHVKTHLKELIIATKFSSKKEILINEHIEIFFKYLQEFNVYGIKLAIENWIKNKEHTPTVGELNNSIKHYNDIGMQNFKEMECLYNIFKIC